MIDEEIAFLGAAIRAQATIVPATPLPDLSALGLETSDADCASWALALKSGTNIGGSGVGDYTRIVFAKVLRDRTRLIAALSEAREREADDEDMAAVGRSLMESLEINREHPFLKNWAPADDPAEVLVDLLNALDAREEAAREEEREACAKLIEHSGVFTHAVDRRDVAAEIRARSAPTDTGGNDSDRSRHFPMKD